MTIVCISDLKAHEKVVGPMQRQLENMKWRFHSSSKNPETKKTQVFRCKLGRRVPCLML